MEKIKLKNKPLVEAIFELRWDIEKPSDPYYKLIIGRFYDKIISEYPYYEQLPTASFPEDMMTRVVQHRFRKTENGWPIVQLGPGVITLNDTDSYNWTDFEKRAQNLLEIFYKTYPNLDNLKITGLQLRYIDSIDFNYNENVFKFLKKHMKLSLNIEESLFKDTNVKNLPIGFDFRSSFLTKKPKGILKLKFARGKKFEKDVLIWETIVESSGKDTPNRDNIKLWIKEAHNLTYRWFIKTIEGELLERFK